MINIKSIKEMNDFDDDRTQIIEDAKKYLLETTNISNSKDEMACLDSFLLRCYQSNWLNGFQYVRYSCLSDKDSVDADKKRLIDLGATDIEIGYHGGIITIDCFIQRRRIPDQYLTKDEFLSRLNDNDNCEPMTSI